MQIVYEWTWISKSVLNDWTLKQSNGKQNLVHTQFVCTPICTTLTMIKYSFSNILITLVLMGADKKKTITAELWGMPFYRDVEMLHNLY